MPSTPATGARPQPKLSYSSPRAMPKEIKRPAAPPRRSQSAPGVVRALPVSSKRVPARRADTQPSSSRQHSRESSRHSSQARHRKAPPPLRSSYKWLTIIYPALTDHRSTSHEHGHHHHHHHSSHSAANGQPQYVVRCNRKHSDDGFYSRCQRMLTKWVKWD